MKLRKRMAPTAQASVHASANAGQADGHSARFSKLPAWAWILYLIAGLSVLLYVAMRCSTAFADFFNLRVSSLVRAILAHLTGWIPFSLAEGLLLASPLFAIAVIAYAVKHCCDSWRATRNFLFSILAVGSLMFSLFVWSFGAGYYGVPISEKLELDGTPPTAEELYDTLQYVIERIEEERQNVRYDSENFSILPMSFSEMNRSLLDAYDVLHEEYPFVQRLHSSVKNVILSTPMSYTHITGVYTFFTGEANLNVNFPDYSLPFTAAHELAHQRGIAKEDEANFIAYLVCIRSEDAYIRYSGYLNLYEYLASALRRADSSLYEQARSSLPIAVRAELTAYANFFDRYEGSVASTLSSTVNDTYLKSQGTQGSVSYGLVVRLAVAYYRDRSS